MSRLLELLKFKIMQVFILYVYHTLNTALQLEKMPNKIIYLGEEVTKEIKDYSQ